MEQDKIGKFIKDLRKKNNLTQKDLANKYGVTYQAVSKWENGKNLPDISLIKQMSGDFNISLDDILNGCVTKKEITKKNYKKISLILLSLLVLGIIIYIITLLNQNNDFKFKTLTSNCNNFNIYGSIAYNQNKSSIYISNINYCGTNDQTNYKKINCSLYESHDNTSVKISSCDSKENISLESYLEDVNFKVDNYSQVCTDFSDESLYLEIEAIDEFDKTITYKIPLSLDDTCKN